MSRNLKKGSLGLVMASIILAAYSGFCLAARPAPPQGEVPPGVKKQVEDALSALGQKISQEAPLSKTSAFSLLAGYLGKNPRIYGAALALVPVKKEGKLVKSAPYVYRSRGKVVQKDLSEAYDYLAQDWYALPVKEGKPVWSRPYYDAGGGEAWMITYSLPIYSQGKDPRLIGVLTSDLLIPDK